MKRVLFIITCTLAVLSSCSEQEETFRISRVDHTDGVVVTFHDQDGNNLIDTNDDKFSTGVFNGSMDGHLGKTHLIEYIRRPEKYYGFLIPVTPYALDFVGPTWYLKPDVVEAFPGESAIVVGYEKFTENNHRFIFNWSRQDCDTVNIVTNIVRKEGWPEGLTSIRTYDWNTLGTEYYCDNKREVTTYSEELSAPTFVYKGKELKATKCGVAPFFEHFYHIDIVKEAVK